MRKHLYGIIALAYLALTIPVAVAAGSHYEYFTTMDYCDTINTTAWWDTTAGELKLPQFAPTLVGSYSTSSPASHVAVSGDYAYVANYLDGLLVLDISDPTDPTYAGSYERPYEPYVCRQL